MTPPGIAITLEFTAWDTSANAGKTGDSANFTLKLVRDGTAASPTNSAAEVDATNCPGLYKLALTAAEMLCRTLALHGKSSTANIAIIPTTIATETLGVSDFGLAQAGASTSITLKSGAVATDDYYKGMTVVIVSGTGVGQSRLITGYVGSTKVAAVDAWAVNPDTDSNYLVVATPPASTAVPTPVSVEAWKGATAPDMTGDAYARLGAPAGASVSADVAAVKSDSAAIKTKTDNLPSDPADESNIIAATDAIAAAAATLQASADSITAGIA